MSAQVRCRRNQADIGRRLAAAPDLRPRDWTDAISRGSVAGGPCSTWRTFLLSSRAGTTLQRLTLQEPVQLQPQAQ